MHHLLFNYLPQQTTTSSTVGKIYFHQAKAKHIIKCSITHHVCWVRFVSTAGPGSTVAAGEEGTTTGRAVRNGDGDRAETGEAKVFKAWIGREGREQAKYRKRDVRPAGAMPPR